MPTYDYACRACGHALEIFQPMNASHLTECPSCHKPMLKRLIGLGAGFLFKGSGFYETDYKRQANPAPATDKKDPDKKAPSASGNCADGQSANNCACKKTE